MDIFRAETRNTPMIHFDTENQLLEIKGKSLPENPGVVYEPLMESIEKYIATKDKDIVANFELDFINTCSSQWIFQILKRFEQAYKSGSIVEINWKYVDEEIQETGEDYQSLLDIPINLVEL